MSKTVLHLVDDATAGGVMQVVNHLTSSPDHAHLAQHQSLQIKRGALMPPRVRADIVVSHLVVSWRTLPSLIALRLRYGRKRLIHVEHSYTEAFVQHNVPRRRRFETLLRLGFRQFNRIAAVSGGQLDWMRKRKLAPQDRMQLVRSYSDLTPFLDVQGGSGPIKHFGAVGRLERQKGFDELIKAFRRTKDPELRLTFFGTGGEEDRLKALAAGDERVEFAGFTATPQSAYRAVDAIVMPSRWEAYGLVAIEAICAGKPVICSDVDGLRDHEAMGAKTFSYVSSQLFQQPCEKPRSIKTRKGLVEMLNRENYQAWRSLLAGCS